MDTEELPERPEIPAVKLVVTPPKFERAEVHIVGKTPYISNKFSEKNKNAMRQKQMEGSQQGKKRGSKPPKDFEGAYQGTLHVSTDGWYGCPASAFRNGLIDACRTVGYAMTRAKLAVFVIADGYDKEDGQGLVRIHGTPRPYEIHGTLADGSTDLIVRGRWDKWEMKPVIEWDADQFTASDVLNLMSRMGAQVGIGAGRPYSKKSAGMGMGTFEVK